VVGTGTAGVPAHGRRRAVSHLPGHRPPPLRASGL